MGRCAGTQRCFYRRIKYTSLVRLDMSTIRLLTVRRGRMRKENNCSPLCRNNFDYHGYSCLRHWEGVFKT
ncbi:hypothetical protein Hypma_010822 [Hypsizygus marmoreus]|uniref:Uncharacterized protein n=1 Tax=Hypsizygus marmoreus TaxID=39966 RepID=A0A369JI00_HYPMA|nr:hypothetical protein Hypma_010822 [Hypsizygus marmoreus]